jgi:hypothetical protein
LIEFFVVLDKSQSLFSQTNMASDYFVELLVENIANPAGQKSLEN